MTERKLIECGDLQRWLFAHHRNPEDWTDGDLDDRLCRFDYFEIREMAIADLEEFDVDLDRVEDYRQMQTAAPPIVFDAVQHSLIDGIHRAHAAARNGSHSILALVGTRDTLEGARPTGTVIALKDLLSPGADEVEGPVF